MSVTKPVVEIKTPVITRARRGQEKAFQSMNKDGSSTPLKPRRPSPAPAKIQKMGTKPHLGSSRDEGGGQNMTANMQAGMPSRVNEAATSSGVTDTRELCWMSSCGRSFIDFNHWLETDRRIKREHGALAAGVAEVGKAGA